MAPWPRAISQNSNRSDGNVQRLPVRDGGALVLPQSHADAGQIWRRQRRRQPLAQNPREVFDARVQSAKLRTLVEELVRVVGPDSVERLLDLHDVDQVTVLV